VTVRSILAACLALLLAFPVFASGARAASDSLGTEFWLAFNSNLGTPQLSLFITGPTATSGFVDIPGLSFTRSFNVLPGAVTTVAIPSTAALTTVDGVENRAIQVTAGAEITVYGLNRIQATTDAFLGLPVDILGTEYIVLNYRNVNVVNATQFAVVASQDATTVTITPSVTTGTHPAGVPYTRTLNTGQAYQLRNTNASPADLSGTIVTADKPIAVFGSHQCANIPAGRLACDHIVEQLTPPVTWGKSFATMPLATRLNGDTFRFLASTDGTQVRVNGTLVATLNRGKLHEQIIAGPAHITSTEPILVAQYSNSSTFDGVTSDPFMMLIPPYEQFLASYTITTPATGFAPNFVNVVAPAAAVGAITLDGTPIPASAFTAIGTSGFSGTQRSISLGAHNLAGPLPFGVFVYGFAGFDSYGYPGGMSLAPVVLVTAIELQPETDTNPVNTEHCVRATVTDQGNQPVAGVRVDFFVTGANPNTGFGNTATDGTAIHCYTGTNGGTDNIRASVGTVTDTATKIWTTNTNRAPTADANGPYEVDEGGSVALDGTGTDPDVGDTLTFSWDLDNDGVFETAGEDPTFSAAGRDGPSTQNVTLKVCDSKNECATDGAVVNINNVAPTITEITNNGPIAEGGSATVQVTATDPAGVLDPLSYEFDCEGDGTYAAPQSGASTSCTFDDNGSFTVGVRVSDDDTGTATATTTVDVTNVAPTANAGPDQTQYWGLPVAFIGSATDPSDADTETGFTFAWTFGDGGTASGANASHTYTTPGGFTAGLSATDKDGGTGVDAAAVTINRRDTGLTCENVTGAFGFGTTLRATLSDRVNAATAILAGNTITFTTTAASVSGTTNAAGLATAASSLLMPDTYIVTATFAGNTLYNASTATCAITITNSVGKITSGLVRFEGKGRGGFNVHNDGTNPVKGELQFQNLAIDLHVHTMTAMGISADLTKGWFAGIGVNGENVLVYVEDNGEPGTDDVVRIWINGTAQNGDGDLSGGNTQIHKTP
jgi:IgGFc binding protein/PKD domain-containing protein